MFDATERFTAGGGFYDTLWIGDGAFVERATRGPAYSTREYPGNLANLDIHSFDGYIEEAAHWQEVMDEWWDLTPVRAKVFWTLEGTAAGGGNTNDDIVWAIRMLALNDTEQIDVAFGTEVTVGDNVVAGRRSFITEATPAISTQNPSLARSPLVVFQVARKVDEENGDYINVDAQSHGVLIQYYRGETEPTQWVSQTP